MCAKTTNEYFQYLFELWGYSHTKSVRQSQTPQGFTIEGDLRIHGWTQHHQHTGVQIHQLLDKFGVGAYRAGYMVRGAVNEFGQAMHHDVSSQLFRAENKWAESVVDHQLDTMAFSDFTQPGYMGNTVTWDWMCFRYI